jgi:hypothetical protein
MKKLILKNGMKMALAGTFVMSAIAPSSSKADDRKSMKIEGQQQPLKEGMADDIKSILQTEAAIIKAIGGVDIMDAPILKDLFPKAEKIDYERIAREVSKVVKEAFVENNLFNEDAKLEATVHGLKRYMTEGRKDDAYLVGRLDHLDEVMARVSESDLRLRSAGYYTSAAQTSLGIMALRIARDPKNDGLREEAWLSIREYRANASLLGQQLRNVANEKVREYVVGCAYIPFQPKPFAFIDNSDKTFHFYETMQKCESELTDYVWARTEVPEFLTKLINGWEKTEIANLGGEEGLASYEKAIDPKTAEGLGLSKWVASTMKYDLMGFTDPNQYTDHLGSVCNAIGAGIQKQQAESKMPAGDEIRHSFLKAVKCPVDSGWKK